VRSDPGFGITPTNVHKVLLARYDTHTLVMPESIQPRSFCFPIVCSSLLIAILMYPFLLCVVLYVYVCVRVCMCVFLCKCSVGSQVL